MATTALDRDLPVLGADGVLEVPAPTAPAGPGISVPAGIRARCPYHGPRHKCPVCEREAAAATRS